MDHETLQVRLDGADRVALEAEAGRSCVIVGYEGPELPRQLTDARVEEAGPGAWRLAAAEGEFRFSARGVEQVERRPGTFDGLLAPFALRPRDRRAVGVLLRLLRLPGGAWLLQRWHSRRR